MKGLLFSSSDLKSYYTEDYRRIYGYVIRNLTETKKIRRNHCLAPVKHYYFNELHGVIKKKANEIHAFQRVSSKTQSTRSKLKESLSGFKEYLLTTEINI